jgi:[ribosomal protein S18]-alanine N-acetyltransferase
MLEPTIMAITYRHLEKEDIAYLRISLYEALFVPDGDEPFDKSIIDSPDISKYAENWGRIGDFGLLVFDEEEYVGAAWGRLYSDSNKSYGFVDASTPEVSIALRPKYREQGIGSELITRLIKLADEKGFRSTSLSVDKRSRAVSFYQRLGFLIIDDLDTAYTMIKSNSQIFD